MVNRFPLFKDDSYFQALEGIYNQLPPIDRQAIPIRALETQMENQANAKSLPPVFGNADTVWRLGWTSTLVSHTCFNETARNHHGCALQTGEDFLDQHSATVTADLNEAPAGQSCEWFLGGTSIATQPCSTPMTFPHIALNQPFSLTVKVNGQQLALADAQTVRSITIVGMGDSFASGEGNPDRPVQYGSDANSYEDTSPLPGIWRYRQYPLPAGSVIGFRGGGHGSLGQRSKWLNDQCHRSLYSHQLRAALQIALEQPQVVVTYLGYACTGAEMKEGLLDYWSARDDVATGRDDSPEIMRALRDLCSTDSKYNAFLKSGSKPTVIAPCSALKQPVDALLLSIGGNDIGFASVIAHEAVNSSKHRWLPVLLSLAYKTWSLAAKPVPFATAEANEKYLPGRYRRLGLALSKYLKLQPGQIIQTGYPQLLKQTSGSCGSGTTGMDVHAILGLGKTTTGPNSLAFVKGFNSVIQANQDRLKWTVATSFADAFAGHSLCDGGMADGTASPDGMAFPLFDRDNNKWTSFNPAQWQPYRPRMRWFVTPNDSFLAGHYMRTAAGSGGDPYAQGIAQPMLAATLGGAFHPNALGQAAIADGVLPALRQQLHLAAP